MKKINFQEHVVPHLIAVVVFLLVTLIFFRPLFFENKVLNQGDITQFLWGSKELRDYREATGEEGLWSTSMFGGMPAYMINVEWSNGVVKKLKSVLSLYLPHPVNNIFLAFLCYYILLIVFRIRWEFSIAGALAFGLCSYMIIGLAAGHNARIGAIAFMPLVMSGIHLAFTNKRWLGLGVTAAALALHLRENHLQITYYLILIVGIYGLAQLWQSYKDKKLQSFATSLAVLIPAALIAAGTFFGPMWAAAELGKYSTRGPSELKIPGGDGEAGLAKDYAFQYSNGILEPATFLVPNFFGGSSSNYLVNDPESATFKALQQVNDQNSFNQLAQFTSSYWGSQPLSAPYYIGAIVCFLFVLGVLLIEGPYKWWLITVSLIGIILSWGSNFPTFNYFLFDHLPGLNKFRSVTFSMIMVFFAFPLLGLLGLEKSVNGNGDQNLKRNLLIAFSVTGGLCFLLWIFPGIMGFVKDFERELPAWLLNALKEDRKALFRSDVLRSFFFIALAFTVLYFNILKWISTKVLALTLFLLVFIDLGLVDSRYFTQENYRRKRDNSSFEPNKADLEIKKDKGIFRVFNLAGFYEARTSFFHHSLGGYSGVRLKRYQELYDSCISREAEQLIADARQGRLQLSEFPVLAMLNARYMVYGETRITNDFANGNAWFVQQLTTVSSPNEELERVCKMDTRKMAVIDNSKFQVKQFGYDSLSRIELKEMTPTYLSYASTSASNGLAVFSEIYYPEGWKATVDGKEAQILRVNYVLRALEVPSGNHKIEFRFEPDAFVIGDKITMASSWVLLLVLLGSLGLSLKRYPTAA